MLDTTDQKTNPDKNRITRSQWFWFLFLYCAGLSVTVAVVYFLRFLMGMG